jgi:hypothetical protein
MFAVALCLSAVAAFYSIVGLTAIFAASVIPVVIMGTILEVAKLTITVWLHEYWQQVKWAMRAYLVPAVVVLMFITSMGIFGFLSKAHIEQVGQGQENAAQLQRIDVELTRQTEIVDKAEARAKTLETTGTGADANVNSQIQTEQQRIDAALARVQPAIDEQNRIIDGQTGLYQQQLVKIEQESQQLQKFIDAKEIDKAQALVGTAVDGNWGPGTAAAVRTWQAARSRERTEVVAKLEQANNNPVIRAAREEIARVRRTVETQVAESNRLIDRLRNQLGKGDTASVEAQVNEQQEKIKAANLEIESLTKKKYELQAEFRKLEVEVGPIKYIAELVYDSTDQTILERAVRWVIILIVAVFDPLAVMMLLAATESMTWVRRALPAPAPVTAPATPEPVKEKTPRYQPGIKKHRIRIRRRRQEPAVPQTVSTDTSPISYAHGYLTNNTDVTFAYTPVSITTVGPAQEEDLDDVPGESDDIKAAKRLWKADNPDKTLKEQRTQLAQGLIDQLPWETYLPTSDTVAFGQVLPDNPTKGYQFLNTGYIPSKLFKYNGTKWIEVDKSLTDSYAYNSAYIEYLMNKILAGEYDPELLSTAEQEQIELKLKPKGQ